MLKMLCNFFTVYLLYRCTVHPMMKVYECAPQLGTVVDMSRKSRDGRQTLRATVTLALTYLLVWSSMPVPALAEIAAGGENTAEEAEVSEDAAVQEEIVPPEESVVTDEAASAIEPSMR